MKVAEECVEEVAPIVLKAFYEAKAQETKSNVIDCMKPSGSPSPSLSPLSFVMCAVVTEWDRKVEALILKRIKGKFPTHHFVAEESHDGNYDISSDEPTW